MSQVEKKNQKYRDSVALEMNNLTLSFAIYFGRVYKKWKQVFFIYFSVITCLTDINSDVMKYQRCTQLLWSINFVVYLQNTWTYKYICEHLGIRQLDKSASKVQVKKTYIAIWWFLCDSALKIIYF